MSTAITGLTIGVTGANGFIGSALIPLLESRGHTVIRIARAVGTRDSALGTRQVVWDPERNMLDPAALEGIDGVCNLAGENIGQRWTPDVKRRIVESRVQSTELIARTMASLSPRPGVLVNMSAVGIYGNRHDEPADERSWPGKGFLVEVVEAWEAATRAASDAGIRVVCARGGVIMHPSASILERLIPIFQLGAGGKIASGRQWLSWIARTDMLRALAFLLETESLGGVVNVTSPEPVRNDEFTRVLARVLHRPALLTVPAVAVKLLYGEMGEETVIGGQRVLPKRLLEAGFAFQHPDLEDAIRYELRSR